MGYEHFWQSPVFWQTFGLFLLQWFLLSVSIYCIIQLLKPREVKKHEHPYRSGSFQYRSGFRAAFRDGKDRLDFYEGRSEEWVKGYKDAVKDGIFYSKALDK